MADFNPIEEAKYIMREQRGIFKFSADRRIPILVDYIDALCDALREAQQWVDKVADEWDHAPAERLSHTIRHLLED